jgi:hypothetical protein
MSPIYDQVVSEINKLEHSGQFRHAEDFEKSCEIIHQKFSFNNVNVDKLKSTNNNNLLLFYLLKIHEISCLIDIFQKKNEKENEIRQLIFKIDLTKKYDDLFESELKLEFLSTCLPSMSLDLVKLIRFYCRLTVFENPGKLKFDF